MTEVITYRGEVAPRKRGWAVLLTLIMPGLGHVYAGDPRRGIVAYLVCFGVAVGCATLTWIMEMFFLRTAMALALFYLYAEVWLVLDVLQGMKRRGDAYVLQSWNHPLIYATMHLALFWLPTMTLSHYAAVELVGSHTVFDEGMYPRLAPGDSIVFERQTGEFAGAIRRGDLAVVNLPTGGRAVLRVAAIPGDSIYMTHSGDVVINEEPLYRQPLGTVMWTNADLSGNPSGSLNGYLEYAQSGPYEVYYSDEVRLSPTRLTVLHDKRYFVLADNRTTAKTTDSRRLGPVGRNDLIGRPLYVWHSMAKKTGTRWRRLGLAAH